MNAVIAANLSRPFLCGLRWDHSLNMESDFCDNDPLWKPDKVHSLDNTAQSTLPSTSGKDYFIMTKEFPWQKFSNIVGGRNHYDNYLVALGIIHNPSFTYTTHCIVLYNKMVWKTRMHASHHTEDANYNRQFIPRYPRDLRNLTKAPIVATYNGTMVVILHK